MGDAQSRGRVLVGTSGWQYDSWRNRFYDGPPALDEYARRFPTVEVNGTFYGLPEEQSVREWIDLSPPGFVFAAKASRYITHMKKLKDPTDPLASFFSAVAPFGNSLEVILFQLPPRWRCNVERLSGFLDALPDGYRYAFEFRDHSWHTETIASLLKAAGAAFCIYHFAGDESPRLVTSDFVYVRLHGAAGRYVGSYDDGTLAGWAGALTSWARTGRDVYLYFDNDQEAAAPRDAARLLEMIS